MDDGRRTTAVPRRPSSIVGRLLPLVAALAMLAAACAGQPTGWAGPALAENAIFVGNTQGRLLALDLASQAVKWEYPPEKDKNLPGIYTTPFVRAGTVYIGSFGDGRVFALDAATGTPRWEVKPDGAVVGDIAASENALYVGAADGLLALDAHDGKLLWRFTGGGGGGNGFWSGAAVEGDTIYVGSPDKRLFALRDEGTRATERWRLDLGGAVVATPRVAGGMVYVGALDSTFYAVDAASGQKKWAFKAGNWFWATAVVAGDTVYAASMDKNVYALDAATGKRKWTFGTTGFIRSTPAFAGGVLVFGNSESHVFGLAPDGSRRWEFIANGPIQAPVTAAGTTAYIVSTNNTLYAVDVNTGTRTWEKSLVKP